MATPYGVTAMSSGNAVVETANISTQPRWLEVPNETGAIVEEINYDTRYELHMTTHGAAAASGTTFEYDSKIWTVDSCEEAGTYNQLKRWNVTAHCYTATTSGPTPSGNGNTNTQPNP